MSNIGLSYNPSDYIVNISAFTRNRPLGVSGLMRVKNEARWVAASIDSCIDALDELIICYQACTDDTAAIVECKRREYPDKIKVYFYAPPVYAHNLTEEEFDFACALPKDSIHLLSNYYNYTLSKATYRYALKIDADQIYFTDRLTRLLNAYRTTSVRETRIPERLAYIYFRGYRSLSYRYPGLFRHLVRILPAGQKIMDQYKGYCLSAISKGSVSVYLSGINLSKDAKEWGVPAFEDGTMSPLYFNGGGDHCVFPVSSQSYYIPMYQSPRIAKCQGEIVCNSFYKKHRIIETFVLDIPSRFLFVGFMWYHMKFVDMTAAEGHAIRQDMPFSEFSKRSCFWLSHRNRLFISRLSFWLFFYDNDKALPSPASVVSQSL